MLSWIHTTPRVQFFNYHAAFLRQQVNFLLATPSVEEFVLCVKDEDSPWCCRCLSSASQFNLNLNCVLSEKASLILFIQVRLLNELHWWKECLHLLFMFLEIILPSSLSDLPPYWLWGTIVRVIVDREEGPLKNNFGGDFFWLILRLGYHNIVNIIN